MRTSALVATFANPLVSLAMAVLVGWSVTLCFGRRVAHLPLARLIGGTVLLTTTAVGGARLHYAVANGLGATLGDPGVHAGGGVIGLAVGVLLLRRVVGLPAAVLADVAAVGAGAALAVYRLGCLARGCCFGTPSDLPWAVRHGRRSVAYLLHANARLVGPDASWSAPVHPLQLYFAAAALAIAGIGWWWHPRRRYDGQVALLSLLAFSFSTLALEPLRAAIPGQTRWGPLPQLVWIAAGLSVASVLLLAMNRHGRPAARH